MSDLSTKALLKTDAKASQELGPGEGGDAQVLSVEQLNLRIKQLLEDQVGVVWLRAEISNFKPHTSGHFYFSLKDSASQISAVMFRGSNSRLRFKPKDGLEVLVRGKITVYGPRGNYQIVCEMMEPVGAGALQKAFEQLKEKLKAEGLFESARKRPIPAFPRHVAVVTSPTGAAIRDILNVMSRRAKSVRVTVVPTIVQGEAAAPKIREALRTALRLPDVDVIIVGRGGGSIEDMWCFNDEALARDIHASPIPIISAVGHEIDFTISDFVADLRAPTPSAAAELVAKSATELTSRLSHLDRLLRVSLDRQMKTLKQKLDGLGRRLTDPRRRLQDLILRNDDLMNRLDLALKNLLKAKLHRVALLRQKLGSPMELISSRRQRLQLGEMRLVKSQATALDRKKARFEKLTSLLDSLSPLKVVDRGYSIVMLEGRVVKSSKDVKAGDLISVRLASGELQAQVTKTKG